MKTLDEVAKKVQGKLAETEREACIPVTLSGALLPDLVPNGLPCLPKPGDRPPSIAAAGHRQGLPTARLLKLHYGSTDGGQRLSTAYPIPCPIRENLREELAA